ncbi:glutathione S-transferase omega-1-like isoform X1 [Dendrobates tinctorius]|uniref:glutathione S-transferase omega-1-like isoform X1 n=1 Tax=Dendrobates tinctorius TaxID=92724 RepID=UPI003CC96B35
MAGSQRSLAKGSAAPGPVPEGILRLYSMRFCPFAQRARLVLVAKGIKHEVVNINLKDKPDWFFEKSPLGLVPSIETSDGKIIYESPIVCDYLDETFPENKLTPADPYEKAQQKILLEHFSAVTAALYKIMFAKKDNQDATELKNQFFEKLKKFEEVLTKRNSHYFGGESVSMIDYMIWPWFERFIIFDVLEVTGVRSCTRICVTNVSVVGTEKELPAIQMGTDHLLMRNQFSAAHVWNHIDIYTTFKKSDQISQCGFRFENPPEKALKKQKQKEMHMFNVKMTRGSICSDF